MKRSQLAEKNQLAIYNRDQEAELGTIKNKLSKQLGRGLKSGPPDYNSSSVTALPS